MSTSARYDQSRSIWSWAFYDWANSAFATTVMAGFFPIFFKAYCSAGTPVTVSSARLGLANSIGTLVIALTAPWLGAVADAGAYRKRFLLFFTLVGVVFTAALGLVHEGQWALAAALYAVANVGFAGALGFYDGLLPVVASAKKIDYVSALGYSLGYIGGGLLFTLNVVMYQQPSFFALADGSAAVKASFVSVAIWWLVFSFPLWKWVDEPARRQENSLLQDMRQGYGQLRQTFRDLRGLRRVALFLAGFFLYNDAVSTVIKMAIDYGMSIGFQPKDLILALLLVQFVGFPSTLLFGKLASRFHPKSSIFFCIAVYLFATVWAARMHRPSEFYILAILVGLVQGGIQALSRSYFSRLIPADKSAEYYGFYNMLGKFSGLLGPVLVGYTALFTSSPRQGILSLVVLFVAGGTLLFFVREETAPAAS